MTFKMESVKHGRRKLTITHIFMVSETMNLALNETVNTGTLSELIETYK